MYRQNLEYGDVTLFAIVWMWTIGVLGLVIGLYAVLYCFRKEDEPAPGRNARTERLVQSRAVDQAPSHETGVTNVLQELRTALSVTEKPETPPVGLANNKENLPVAPQDQLQRDMSVPGRLETRLSGRIIDPQGRAKGVTSPDSRIGERCRDNL